MKIQKNIDIYLLKKHQKRTIEAVQYDTGVQLVFSILDFDLPEGCTATIYVRKKSGNCVYQECGVAVEDNTVIVDLNNQALTETGECAYQIRLMKDDNIVSTFAGTMWVAPSLVDVDAEESKTVLSALDNVIAESTEKIFSEKSDELLASRANAIVCEKEGDAVSISDSSESPLRGLTVYGKTTQNGTPTPEAPAELVNSGDKGTIETVVCGKNLFGGDALADAMLAQGDVTHNAEDKTLEYTGAKNGNKFYFDNFKPNTQYTFILYGRNIGGTIAATNLAIQYTDGMVIALKFSTMSENSYCVLTSVANKTIEALKGVNQSGSSLLYYEKCGIFEGVLPQEAFERYKGQSLTVPTPDGLRGIPVSSGGNYTDDNGQQWICDEVDFERGIYVQRVGEKVFDGTNEYRAAGTQSEGYFTAFTYETVYTIPYGCVMLSDRFKGYANIDYGASNFEGIYPNVSNGVRNLVVFKVKSNYVTDITTFKDYMTSHSARVIMPLATPIETPLTAEQIEAFKALCSYYPNTNVLNDDGAGLAVKYAADTKLYIDNKFAELSAAILEG